jgi:hypothetical protein
MPTIRIDNEIYGWLKSQAIPFEDSPNSVLRRIAGLDKTKDSAKHSSVEMEENKFYRAKLESTMESLDGKHLIDFWGVNVKHGLYSREGTWYQNLKSFPGALFDYNGYVLFKNEQEYENSPYLNIGKETNVHQGISNIPGYKRVRP